MEDWEKRGGVKEGSYVVQDWRDWTELREGQEPKRGVKMSRRNRDRTARWGERSRLGAVEVLRGG